MPILSLDAAQSRLAQLSGWAMESGELVRTFEFKDFVAALAFVNKVGELAEQAAATTPTSTFVTAASVSRSSPILPAALLRKTSTSLRRRKASHRDPRSTTSPAQ